MNEKRTPRIFYIRPEGISKPCVYHAAVYTELDLQLANNKEFVLEGIKVREITEEPARMSEPCEECALKEVDMEDLQSELAEARETVSKQAELIREMINDLQGVNNWLLNKAIYEIEFGQKKRVHEF